MDFFMKTQLLMALSNVHKFMPSQELKDLDDEMDSHAEENVINM